MSLQQFLRLNSTEVKKTVPMEMEIEVDENQSGTNADLMTSEEGKHEMCCNLFYITQNSKQANRSNIKC